MNPLEQLAAIAADLQKPHGDVNDRVGAATRAVLGVIGVMQTLLAPAAPHPNSPPTDPMDQVVPPKEKTDG